ncbi:FaeA/PapI family transcriptional regulator [Escherichia coli]|uniref:FaeA/PapI family transcriptional regulator n=1 Tax=Escherichia coli TaxID=562 RepID=UPI0021014754|nr:FaeA/PapI family transcriptional regulator [Escherichia coli]MCQ1639682.1 FaeA/PapI family transcriptional regulator [Escherichia coli]
MEENIDAKIIDFFERRKKNVSKLLLSTREIADEIGLTIYQTREHLKILQSSYVVEKINSGRGTPGLWRLL